MISNLLRFIWLFVFLNGCLMGVAPLHRDIRNIQISPETDLVSDPLITNHDRKKEIRKFKKRKHHHPHLNQLGATIVVNPGDSIQAAIDSASNGDTILIMNGTYIEPIHIVDKSLNIVGENREMTIIQALPPSTHLPITQSFVAGGNTYYCVAMVSNSQPITTTQTVNISNLTVDGDNQQDTTQPPGQYSGSMRFYGIGYNDVNGTIDNVHILNMKQSSNFTENAGGGVVGSATAATVIFNVTNSLIELYQRIGIFTRGGDLLTANISGNIVNRGFITTEGTPSTTPSGIQISSKGSVTNNTVSTNITERPGVPSVGILLFTPVSNITVTDNIVTDNDIGIEAFQVGDGVTISNNNVSFTTTPFTNAPMGVIVFDTTGTSTLALNTINMNPMNPGPGLEETINMWLISDISNENFNLMRNQFLNGQMGLYVQGGGSFGPVVTMDMDSFVGTLGYYIEEDAAPNDIWPSTATVSFDGLVSGFMSLAQFQQVMTKIFDKHDDPALGLVLDFIVPTPVVTDVMPSFGPASGGNTVTITGANFVVGATTVKFGSNPATNVVVQSTTVLTVTAPAGSGTVDVTVTTPEGTSAISQFDHYTYNLTPPTLISITPHFGPESGGTAVDITGTGFETNNTIVFFGSNAALSVVVHSAGALTAIAPPGTGTVDVTVITSMGQSAITPADRFAYIPADLTPHVTSIAPKLGPESGGTIVTIMGVNFVAGATTVHFGANLATNVFVQSSMQLTVTAPAGTGIVDVTVTTPNGTSVINLNDKYIYFSPIPPSPAPPSHFIGVLKERENSSSSSEKRRFILKATWDPSPSPDVIAYRIYKNGKLVAEISATTKLVFKTHVPSKKAAKKFAITAVNSSQLESVPVQIKIKRHVIDESSHSDFK